MTPEQYQNEAARTLLARPPRDYSPEEIMLVWNALGLAGEAGEVADYIKKCIFHDHPLDVEKLIKELGDVQWYLAALATKIQVTLSQVMETNIEKLKARYPVEFNVDDSINRSDS